MRLTIVILCFSEITYSNNGENLAVSPNGSSRSKTSPHRQAASTPAAAGVDGAEDSTSLSDDSYNVLFEDREDNEHAIS